MILTRPCRSVCATMSSRWRLDKPVVKNLCSSCEWSGSSIVTAKGSPNTVAASSNDTACFARFLCAFSGSHSNTTTAGYHDDGPALIAARRSHRKQRPDTTTIPPRDVLPLESSLKSGRPARAVGRHAGLTAYRSAASRAGRLLVSHHGGARISRLQRFAGPPVKSRDGDSFNSNCRLADFFINNSRPEYTSRLRMVVRRPNSCLGWTWIKPVPVGLRRSCRHEPSRQGRRYQGTFAFATINNRPGA